MGQRVSNASVSTASAADGEVATGEGAVACVGEGVDTTGSSVPEHPAAIDAHASTATIDRPVRRFIRTR